MGEWNVDGLVRQMPARLFAEWQAYYALEPFGAERDNWHAATLGKLMYDLAVRPQDRELEIADLMYHDAPNETEEPERSAEELYAQFRAMAVGMGARKT